MIESFVSDQIIKYLEDHAFISIDQSAYLKRYSTQTSLHRVIDDWLEQIHDNSLTGVCLLDMSKCFDSINHEILLKKLEMYGITGNELDWVSSYLKNRKQMVFFNRTLPTFKRCTGPFLRVQCWDPCCFYYLLTMFRILQLKGVL